ncbi:MAG TPA: SDR family NAD(P)-dependent oxidoreductase [Acidimicrobiales bacterium]|nr:SDR family NAD(P)-dependent oxidoreductase [Acidimicrobiales bacterium]
MSRARGTGDVFAGRLALVTGGSGGIGAALCQRLAMAGARVAIHYRADEASARRVLESVGEVQGEAEVFGADLASPDAPDRLLDEVEARMGSVDILAANAGTSSRATYDEAAALWDYTMSVNLRAPYLLARRVLPHMRKQHFGRVLFTSSVAAITGGIVGPHYAASKAGLHGLAHHLAARVAADGVTVNVIAPALIEDTAMLPGDPAELARLVPVGRLGRPEEVADLAMAMLSNAYLTNKVVTLDGGMAPR